jgi:hypothetical protein
MEAIINLLINAIVISCSYSNFRVFDAQISAESSSKLFRVTLKVVQVLKSKSLQAIKPKTNA